MKILMLTPYLPYPLLSGGQIRTYNLLKNLSQHHQITLFALIKDKIETEYIQQLTPFCSQVKVFKRTKNPWALRNILMAGFTAYPFLVTRNLPANMRRAIKSELAKHHYDLIHAETFYMMPNIPKTSIPVLLVEQTIEYLGYEYYVKRTKNPLLRQLLQIDVSKIRYWEKHFWRKAQHLVTMSEDDKKYIHSQVSQQVPIDVVANGVDIDRFSKVRRVLPKDPTILFVGTFKWLPNIDAVSFLVEKIWPGIKAKLPNAKLWIVGHSPTEKVIGYGSDPDITVSANVADIREAYSQAHVLLAPIRSGKGTRYKILESMATGTPVVTTPLGAEGLRIESGKHALIANSAQELVKQTVSLLNNPEQQRELSIAAKALVKSDYSWDRISKNLDQLYRQMGER